MNDFLTSGQITITRRALRANAICFCLLTSGRLASERGGWGGGGGSLGWVVVGRQGVGEVKEILNVNCFTISRPSASVAN